jgi:UDPglucose 6-dehydrogenase
VTVLERSAEITAQIVLICVGTPIDEQGRADMTAVESVLTEVRGLDPMPITVIRSTTPVGTCSRLLRDGHVADESRFFAVPEFLAQGTALADFAAPHRVVIGHSATADEAALAPLVEVFGSFGAPVRLVSLEEAELIKNGANAFLALKISFVNELAVLAERSGADIGPVLEAIGLDPRIGSTYMRPSFGFGGSCLPKELQTIALSGQERGLPMHVTAAATAANLAQQRHFAERIDAVVGGVDGRRIALLGLAFKAGTDDIRFSPAVGLARWLLEHGADVHATDPAAAGAAQRALPGLVVHDAPLDALAGADAAVIATEWPHFKALDWAAARDTMARPVVIDGRRLLEPDAMRVLGFEYARVGTPSSPVPAMPPAAVRGGA